MITLEAEPEVEHVSALAKLFPCAMLQVIPPGYDAQSYCQLLRLGQSEAHDVCEVLVKGTSRVMSV